MMPRKAGTLFQHKASPDFTIHLKAALTTEYRRTMNIFYSTSSSSEANTSSSKNSNNVISKPRASIITVLNVTVLFLPFMIQAMLPCRMPDFCSNRYCDIFFSASNADMRFATASFTVIGIPPLRSYNYI